MSSCGNGNCSCGSSCSCGSGCNCAYPDLGFSESTFIAGVSPLKSGMSYEVSEMSFGAENGCQCGSNCSCNPCRCGK